MFSINVTTRFKRWHVTSIHFIQAVLSTLRTGKQDLIVLQIRSWLETISMIGSHRYSLLLNFKLMLNHVQKMTFRVTGIIVTHFVLYTSDNLKNHRLEFFNCF